jgi:hypothetical protein
MFWDKEVGAQYYNVYFGLADRLKSGDKGYCYHPGAKTFATPLTDNPDPGKIFWYLATSYNGTEGSAGKASNGTQRQVPSPCDENAANDWDKDGVLNRNDNCRFDANASQADADLDGLGDVCDPFSKDPYNDSLDGDGVGTDIDNCPFVSNPTQTDTDGDGVGDACDDCPSNYDPLQQDMNKNHIGDACDPDTDGDGIPNAIDPDIDNDGVPNAVDNYPFTENELQLDRDNDGTGDACDTNDKEIGGVSVSKGANPRLSWTREVGSTGYSIYTDLVSNLVPGGLYGTCYKANTALPFADLTDGNPPLGQARYYLVTGFFGGVQGSAGKDSQGAERNLPPGCP